MQACGSHALARGQRLFSWPNLPTLFRSTDIDLSSVPLGTQVEGLCSKVSLSLGKFQGSSAPGAPVAGAVCVPAPVSCGMVGSVSSAGQPSPHSVLELGSSKGTGLILHLCTSSPSYTPGHLGALELIEVHHVRWWKNSGVVCSCTELPRRKPPPCPESSHGRNICRAEIAKTTS